MSDIYPALAAVMADVSHVAKRDRNSHQNFNFRGIDAVVNAVGPALRKHKVMVMPQVVSATYETVATTTGKPVTSCRIVADYTFYAPDGSHVTARAAGEAFDSGDKATPKAMSVTFRTALLQALALPTDEADPDSMTYERDHGGWGASAATAPDPTPMTDKTRARMIALFDRKGVGEGDQLAGINSITGGGYTSRGDLTEQHAQQVIAVLNQKPDAPSRQGAPEGADQ